MLRRLLREIRVIVDAEVLVQRVRWLRRVLCRFTRRCEWSLLLLVSMVSKRWYGLPPRSDPRSTCCACHCLTRFSCQQVVPSCGGTIRVRHRRQSTVRRVGEQIRLVLLLLFQPVAWRRLPRPHRRRSSRSGCDWGEVPLQALDAGRSPPVVQPSEVPEDRPPSPLAMISAASRASPLWPLAVGAVDQKNHMPASHTIAVRPRAAQKGCIKIACNQLS